MGGIKWGILGRGRKGIFRLCIRDVRRGRWVFLGKRRDYSSSSVEMWHVDRANGTSVC